MPGILSILGNCACGALASVYFEHLLKATPVSALSAPAFRSEATPEAQAQQGTMTAVSATERTTDSREKACISKSFNLDGVAEILPISMAIPAVVDDTGVVGRSLPDE